LRTGIRLSYSIVDTDGTLLLAAGTQLTDPIKKCLVDRGISKVMLHPQDVATMFAAPTKPVVQPAAPPVLESPPTISETNAQLASLASRVSLTVANLGPPLKERQRR